MFHLNNLKTIYYNSFSIHEHVIHHFREARFNRNSLPKSCRKNLIIYYLFQHVLWKIFLAVHGQNGRYDLLVGHLELGQQDGTVLGPAPVDDRQLFVGLGLGGALSVLPVIVLLFLVG